MINRAKSSEELDELPKYGILSQKIRALLIAYGTKYDFCRFYYSSDFVFSEQNGSFVLCEKNLYADYDELAEFFDFYGYVEIFCSDSAGKKLVKHLNCRCEFVNLMRFNGTGIPCNAEKNPDLNEVYNLLKTSFDIEFESWYLDMSHRIRHGVSEARKLYDSVLVIQHNLNGEALLSQICTSQESRGKGNGSRLIRGVCAELFPSAVYVLCRNELVDFYRKIGFEAEGKYCQICK